MSFYDLLSMSLGNLWRRKLRTCLTVLGVLIGTASIVAMLSLAVGMKSMMMEQVSGMGSATQITVSGLICMKMTKWMKNVCYPIVMWKCLLLWNMW